jgi:enoyl-CoA hydratase
MTAALSSAPHRSGKVRVERPHAHYAVITLNNPPSNQLSRECRQAFVTALADLEADLDIRCVVITGAERCFTAGADLREEAAMTDEDVSGFLAGFSAVFDGMEGFRVPIIAAINGATVGGGLEFALCCDIRIASSEAVFVAAGVNVGLIASFYRLPRVVGEGPAKDLLLTGRKWTAEEALRWGLVTALHPPERLMEAAHELAQRIVTRAPLSVEATKGAVHLSRDATRDEAHEIMVERFLEMFRTDDHREAVAALLEHRPATYDRR